MAVAGGVPPVGARSGGPVVLIPDGAGMNRPSRALVFAPAAVAGEVEEKAADGGVAAVAPAVAA